jgi:hypothetical protein
LFISEVLWDIIAKHRSSDIQSTNNSHVVFGEDPLNRERWKKKLNLL